MFNSRLFCTAILTLALAAPAAAQRLELISIPLAADRPVSASVENSDVALVESAADWISNVFGLPRPTLPAVRRIPAGKSAFLAGSGITHTAVMNYQRSPHEMVAHYDDASKTISLPDGWNGSTPAEMSVLVHAMVHHFQNVSGRKYYDCPEARKALPYEAHERWLGLYGRSLSEDFKIEPATLMLITQCMP